MNKVEEKVISDDSASADRLPPNGTGALLKYYVTKEEFAALDEATRAHYFALGDDYRIKPEVTNTRQQKVALVVLFGLAMTFAVIGLYGYKIDSLQLQISGFCGACRHPSDFCFA